MVRSPVYLGGAIATVGIILMAQSIPSAIIGVVALACFLMASIKESDFNVQKFGEEYERYMEEMPMWNFFKGFLHLWRGKRL